MINLSGRILAVVSHPDDETFGCGGTLALHASIGSPVSVLCLTCNPPSRRDEIMSAAEELGIIEPIVLDNSTILQTQEFIKKVSDHIVTFKPSVVLTHIPFDYHWEHIYTYNIVKEAVEWAAHTTNYDEPCLVEKLLMMEVNTLIPNPHIIVDVSGTMEAKRKATKHYSSQLSKFNWGYYEMFNEKKAELRGVQGGCDYAEAFLVEPLARNSPFYANKSVRSVL